MGGKETISLMVILRKGKKGCNQRQAAAQRRCGGGGKCSGRTARTSGQEQSLLSALLPRPQRAMPASSLPPGVLSLIHQSALIPLTLQGLVLAPRTSPKCPSHSSLYRVQNRPCEAGAPSVLACTSPCELRRLVQCVSRGPGLFL